MDETTLKKYPEKPYLPADARIAEAIESVANSQIQIVLLLKQINDKLNFSIKEERQ